jgi:uncharacterized protein (TIGR03437 family)
LFGQLLYVGNFGDQTISTYVIDQESGLLTEVLPRAVSPGSPTSVAIHPSGKFVYVTNGGVASANVGPSLASFSINASTGALTLLSTLPLTPGSSPNGAAVDASGKFLFFASGGSGTVSVFSIDSSTGALTAVPGSPFAAGQNPAVVTVHPNGKFAYVAAAGAGQIAAFNIGSDGALTPVEGSPFAARNNLFWMAMDRAGKFLFAVQRQDNAVNVYSVNESTGALTQVGSPFPAGAGVSGVAVDPAGKYLYVSAAGTGAVTVFTIGATGAPTQRQGFGAILGAFAAILDPSGRFLYVPGQQANAVAAFAIDPNSGALTPLPQQFFPAGVQPQRGASIMLSPAVLPPISADSAFNAFSVAPRGMPNAGIAQGSQFSVSGKNIGPAVGVEFQDFPLKTEIAGVSIQIQSGDVATSALMVEVSNDLVTGIVPSNTPLGDATVTVSYKGRTTSPLPVTIVTTSVGLATRSRTGNGPTLETMNASSDTVLSLDTVMSSNLPSNALHRPAKPGQRIIIEATGLGAVSGNESQASAQELSVPADVIVGNKLATVITKLRIAGFDFILIQLPDDVPEGCYVPIAVRAGGVTSNVASISISATGDTCSDPTGLAASDIDAARRSGQISMGTILVGHYDLGPLGTDDFAAGIFASVDFNSLLRAFSPGNNGGGVRAAFAMPPLGTCTVSRGSPVDSDDFLDLPADPTPLRYINVGQGLNMSGPAGTVQLPGPSYEFETGKNVFTPGDYTVDNGTGTQSFGAFKAVLSLPPMATWTNRNELVSVDRAQDLTVTWSGGVPDKEYVAIVGLAASQQATGGFYCVEKVSAGKFTVPAWVLSSLPASATFTLGDQTLTGGLIGLGTAPLTSASRFTTPGLDFGVFTYEQATVNLVPYR